MNALLARVPADAAGEVPEVAASYLHPGKVLAFAEPALITTVLGSCVSVCLWDAWAGVGGMNHFLLPDVLSGNASPRFAGPAFEQLVARLLAHGARRERLQAKTFGGASLGAAASGEPRIGSRNVEAARRLLTERAIPIVAEDVGGNCGRKLVFETAGGAAWVRRLRGAGA